MAEARSIHTSDGVALEAEFAAPTDAPTRAAMVLCHPHPQYGGTMRSIVISALFEALPRAGVACLRFNFRGTDAVEVPRWALDFSRPEKPSDNAFIETFHRKFGAGCLNAHCL